MDEYYKRLAEIFIVVQMFQSISKIYHLYIPHIILTYFELKNRSSMPYLF